MTNKCKYINLVILLYAYRAKRRGGGELKRKWLATKPMHRCQTFVALTLVVNAGHVGGIIMRGFGGVGLTWQHPGFYNL